MAENKFVQEIKKSKFETHYFKDGESIEGKNKHAADMACTIFVECRECEELLFIAGKEQSNVGKLAVIMKGENLYYLLVDKMQKFSKSFIPLGIETRFFLTYEDINPERKP